MKHDLSSCHTFVAGGLGEIRNEIVTALIEAKSNVTILYSSDKYYSRAEELKKDLPPNLRIQRVDYLNNDNVYETLSMNVMRGITNSLISTV